MPHNLSEDSSHSTLVRKGQTEMDPIDGIYVAYLSAAAGQGVAMLHFVAGRVVGADLGGVLYDGRYVEAPPDAYQIDLVVSIPAGTALVQGDVTGPELETYSLTASLPRDFLTRPFVRIEGKHGPVNARLVRLRRLNDD